MSKIFIFLILVTLMPGCFFSKTQKKRNFEVMQVDYPARDIAVPVMVIDMLKKQYLDYYRAMNPESALEDLELLKLLKVQYVELKAKIWGKNPGTLTKNVEFKVPVGGGVIDFANFVSGNTGSFYFTVKILDDQEENETAPKALFISNSPPREIEGESYGLGCGKVAEIDSLANREIFKKGFRLNATDLRYVAQASGTFIFYKLSSEGISLAALAFEDSRYEALACRKTIDPGLAG